MIDPGRTPNIEGVAASDHGEDRDVVCTSGAVLPQTMQERLIQEKQLFEDLIAQIDRNLALADQHLARA